MVRNRKRTIAIQNLIDEVNLYFRVNNVKDEHTSDLFNFISSKLLHNRMYQGYNFFVRKFTDDGIEYCQLAGTADKDKYDFIQFL